MVASDKKRIGIIGGLGPEAGASLYLDIIENYRQKRGEDRNFRQPQLMLWTVPISLSETEDLDIGGKDGVNAAADMILDGIQRLARSGCTVIGIACNTVHEFFGRYSCAVPGLPILNIVDETVKMAKSLNVGRIAVLGSTYTIQSGLYSIPLLKAGITAVVPTDEQQESIVLDTIQKTMLDGHPERHKERLRELIMSMGVTAVILGCTELPLIIQQQDIPSIKVISTIQILGKALSDF